MREDMTQETYHGHGAEAFFSVLEIVCVIVRQNYSCSVSNAACS